MRLLKGSSLRKNVSQTTIAFLFWFGGSVCVWEFQILTYRDLLTVAESHRHWLCPGQVIQVRFPGSWAWKKFYYTPSVVSAEGREKTINLVNFTSSIISPSPPDWQTNGGVGGRNTFLMNPFPVLPPPPCGRCTASLGKCPSPSLYLK